MAEPFAPPAPDHTPTEAMAPHAPPSGVPGLVGRTQELAELRARFAEAAAGRGALVALGGEAGIGKTRLAQALAALAHAGGAAVWWGRAYEGDWAPPYGPWVEATSDHLRDADPARLRAALGSGAPALAALLPALRAALPDLPPPADLPPAEARFRLHEAAVALVLDAADPHPEGSRPLVLVLDDLHWADRPSLALLLHLARALGRARVLVLATYRDAEPDRDHPLTAALAALRREPVFAPLAVRGLAPAEVADLIAQTAHRPVGPALGRAVHGETGGNPFYVGEVARHLLAAGGAVPTDRAGRWETDRGVRDLGVPAGVREVVALRLARLPEPARRLLDAAAVFSGGVDFATLAALTDLPEADLLDALDAALAAGLLRPVDGRLETYDFAHAIVRHALADGRNPSRAARLYRAAAEAVERVHAGRERAHAAELALLYHASAALPGAARGLPHALAAAEAARAAFARERAVAFLRIARDLAAGLDPGTRGAVLSRLAAAEADALLLADAEATVRAALAALEEGDAAPPAVAAFLHEVAAAVKDADGPAPLWRALLDRGLALLGADRGLTWARLTLLRDPVEPIPGPLRAARWLGFDPEAVAVARLRGDEEDHARTLESFDPRDRAATRALVALGRAWTRPTAALRALTVAANDLQYRHGAFAEAATLWDELLGAAERVGALGWQAQALTQLTFLHVARGDLAAARAAETAANARYARLGPDSGAAAFRTEMATALALAGDGGDWPAIAADLERQVVSTGDPGAFANLVTGLAGLLFAALAALAHARAGAPDRARALVAALTDTVARTDPTAVNQGHNGAVAFAVDALWTLGAPEDADAAKPYRAWAHDLLAAGVGDYPQTSLHLTVARAAALLGADAEAREGFALARGTLETSGQRPLRAVADHDEALAILRSNASADPARAAELAEAARAAFAALGLDGWAARAAGLHARALERLSGRPQLPGGLTEREADVLRLVARGLSDRQIAADLYISPRTVNAHVRNMLTKTDRANRTELSVWAVEQGLVTR